MSNLYALLLVLAPQMQESVVPPTAREPLPRPVANAALAAPEARADLERALVDTHRYLIGDIEAPPTLDTAVLDAAVRQKLLEARPELASIVPSIPPLELPLPSSGLPVLRQVRTVVDTATGFAALLAVVIALGALAISSDRGWVLRRIGRWAICAGLLWVALRFAVPPLTQRLLPGSSSLLGGLATAIAERMAGPGAALMAFGAVCLGLGGILGWFRRRRRHAAQEGGDRYAELAGRAERAPKRGRKAAKAAALTVAADAQAQAEAQAAQEYAAALAYAEQEQRAQAAAFAAAAERENAQAAEASQRNAMPSFLSQTAVGRAGAPPTDGVSLSPLGTPNALPTSFMNPAAAPAGFSYSGAPPQPTQPVMPPTTAPTAPPMFTTASFGAPSSRPTADTGLPATPPVQQPPTWGRSPEETNLNVRPRRPHVVSPQAPPATLAGGRVPLSDPKFPGNWLGGFTLDPGQHPRVADPAPPPPRWVEGVGYVFEYPPFEGVRWVEGLGYVVTEEELGQANAPN